MKNVIKLIGVMAVTVCSANVFATAITTPMTLADSHIVGIIDSTVTGGSVLSGGPTVEMTAAQNLLNLGLGGTATIGGNLYKANTAIDFSSTLTDYFKPADSFFPASGPWSTAQLTITGYDFVMGKYDGPNAGYILFSLTDADSHVIPEYPDNFWTTSGKFQISHWVAFNANSVPEPSIVALLAMGLLGIVVTRRKMKV